jgi:hypothetical protein
LRRLAFETLEDRRMLFVPFGGGAVWGTTDLTFSYSNFLDGSWVSGLTNQQITQAAEEAMGIWASVTPLTFTQTGDSGPAASDSLYEALTHPLIRWGHHLIDGPPVPMMTNTLGHGFRPGAGGRNGDIHFDNADTFTADGFLELATHEIGHSLGLDHPNGDVADFDGDGDTECPGPFTAIMHACIGGGGTWDYTALGTAFLLQDDIDGIRSLYDAGLGYVLNSTGQLSVFGTNQADFFQVAYDFGTNLLTVSNGANSFTRTMSGITQVAINGQDGEDIVLVNALPSHVITVVNGGAGNDNLTLRGSEGGDRLQLLNGTLAYNNNSGILFSDISSVTLSGHGGADVLEVAQTPADLPVTINGGASDDTITLGPSPFASQVILSAVTVFGDAGNDTLLLGSNNGDSIDANVTFHGGGHNGFICDRIVFNDTAPSYNINYNITSTVITRDGINLPHTVSYSDTEGIVINAGSGSDTVTVGNGVTPIVTANGNDGNDNFIRGGGNVSATSGANFNGGNGTDRITFDDHLRPGNLIWDLRNNEVIYGGLILFETTNFESVGILAGNGNDEITFTGNLLQSFNIDAGGGQDEFIVGFQGTAQFNAPVTLTGGAGNDTFTWRNGSRNWGDLFVGQVVWPVLLDGGGGFNILNMDETARTQASVEFYHDRIYTREPAPFAFGADINYDNMGAIGLTCSNSANNASVYGVSSDIAAGQQVSILLSGGNDTVTLVPRDAQGNLTINGNLGIGGGPGTDTLTVNDAASSLPIYYLFQNRFGAGTTNIAGLGAAGFGAGADIEGIVVNAGMGKDTFDVETYLAAITLTINAGDGDDVLEITPISKNLAANMSAGNNVLAFHGDIGYDTIGIHNENNNNGNVYTVNGTQLNVSNRLGFPNFAAFFPHTGVEYTTVNAGPQSDTILVYNTGPNTVYDFDDGPGAVDDFYGIGFPLGPQSITSVIRGGVRVSGVGGGADTVTIYNTADTVGRTLHIENNFVGRMPGDDLFGPGGYLEYVGIAGTMTIKLGRGDDVVYSMPHPLTKVKIEGNEPAASDFLGLAFAAVTNPLITPSGAGAGIYTFDNAAPIEFTGMESAVIDDVAPQIIAQSYDDESTPMIQVQFSEDVSTALNASFFELINTTTSGQTPFGVLAMTYDVVTNTASFTFPGYPNGILPPGEYTAKIYASVSDLFGNRMGVETPFSFTVGPQPPALLGDYNQNGEVDAVDYIVWRKSLGEAIAAYSGADGSGNGTVDGADYEVWRAHFGETLPPVAGNGLSTSVESAAAVAPDVSESARHDAEPTTPSLTRAFVSPQRRSPIAARSGFAIAAQRATTSARQDELLAAWLAPVEWNRAGGDEYHDLVGGSVTQDARDELRRAAFDRAWELWGQQIGKPRLG